MKPAASRVTRSFGAVCPRYLDLPILVTTRHMYSPRIAANLAVLDEGAGHVRLDVDFHLLAAERTCDQKVVRHFEDGNAGWDPTTEQPAWDHLRLLRGLVVAAVLVACALQPHPVEARGPSTPEERSHFVALVRLLESNPWKVTGLITRHPARSPLECSQRSCR